MAEVDTPDPFLIERDPREEEAVRVFRETLLAEKPPERLFRQDRTEGGYALVVPDFQGERILTIPAANESDFTYHGNPGSTTTSLATFIATALEDAPADALRLPLLPRPQAIALHESLAMLLPGWSFSHGVTAVRPTVDKRAGGWRRRNSLWKAHDQARDHGLLIESIAELPHDELLDLHRRRWGVNRSPGFFRMLDGLLKAGVGCARSVRLVDGSLVALQVDVTATWTRYFYYGVNDVAQVPGVGNAIMGASWKDFVHEAQLVCFSFGRGSERYKFRHANRVDELCELRGFYAPSIRV